MKKTIKILVSFFAFFLGSTVSARDFYGGISYLKSSWGIKKEKILPYEYCAIHHTVDSSGYGIAVWSPAYFEFSKPSIGLLHKWKDLEPLHSENYLVCWIGVNNYAFAIPLQLGKLGLKGISIELMGNALKFNFHNLDGMKVSDLEGKYAGYVNGMGALLVGYKGGRMWNQSISSPSQPELSFSGWYAGLAGFVVGKSTIEISLGGEKNKLIDKTDPENKGIETSDLMEYKFVKIKSRKRPLGTSRETSLDQDIPFTRASQTPQPPRPTAALELISKEADKE